MHSLRSRQGPGSWCLNVDGEWCPSGGRGFTPPRDNSAGMKIKLFHVFTRMRCCAALLPPIPLPGCLLPSLLPLLSIANQCGATLVRLLPLLLLLLL